MLISAINSRLIRFFYHRSHLFYRALRFFLRRDILIGFRLQPKMEKLWGTEGRCDSMGVPLFVSLSDLKGYSLWIEGTAQFEKIEFLASALAKLSKPGPAAFIDCGANYGEFLALLNSGAPISHWTALEPNPNVNAKLEKTLNALKENKKYSHIFFDLEKKAVVPAGESSLINLHFNPAYSGGGSLLKDFSSGNSQSLQVATVAIPQIFSKILSFSKPSVVVIKIDVEGYEFELLPAFLQELRTHHLDYLILFETHLKDVKMRSKLQVLIKDTVDQQVVYPQKYAALNLLSGEIPLTQYDIAIASWKLN